MRHLKPIRDPNLLVGTSTHDDAGVYRLTDDIALVQTLDFFPPVVDDAFVYGQIAAANALSDVYAMGGVPRTALVMACFPDNQLSMDWLGKIESGGEERCQKAQVTIVGGHTVRDPEIKFGLAVTGLVHPDRIITNAGAKPGDRLVLTKPLGTGFVTTANKKNSCPPSLYAAACASMVHLNDGACRAMLATGVHAATDITGFGLAGHGLELALGSEVTIILEMSRLPLFPEIAAVARPPFFTRASASNRAYVAPHLHIEGQPDPVALECAFDAQTSGGLLISVPENRCDDLIARARAEGVICADVVGSVRPRGEHALVFQP